MFQSFKRSAKHFKYFKHFKQIGLEIIDDEVSLNAYAYDNSSFHNKPLALVFVKNHDEVVELVKFCYENQIAICPRGRGTSTTGSSVASQGAIMVSFEKMNKILDYRADDGLMVVECGVSNQEVQKLAFKDGLMWAPDPSSSQVCTIGGNLACNAGGPRTLSYGATRENVLGLKAVNGRAETLICGMQTTKGAVGYDLTRLLIGSEGTLGLITEANLKLTPLPRAIFLIQVFFSHLNHACEAIIKLNHLPHTVFSLEIVDDVCLDLMRKKGVDGIIECAEAMLMVSVEGLDDTDLSKVELVKETLKPLKPTLLKVAQSSKEKNELTKTRKALSPLLKSLASHRLNEDVVVPVSKLALFFNKIKVLSKKYDLKIVNFGHAGNGNIHTNILYHLDNEDETQRAFKAMEDLFELVIGLSGTISGEHGIGLAKKPFTAKAIEPNTLNMMRLIKTQFDPKLILNPGKVFDFYD